MRDRDTISTAGQTLPGGLRILDPMGSTPEGTLYHAEYLDGREAALLLAAPGSSEVDAARREWLERAIQIQHVNVARIYATGELGNGSLYVVLEKLGGEPLSRLLAAGRVFSLPEALNLALQVAAGLQAAHRAGFVHGNLSPDTILLTGAGDGRAQIKLIGFELDLSLGRAGNALSVKTGASEYASPERLAGHPPDEQSDVFSLGAVLHHLLTGRPPDSGKVDGSVPGLARDVLGTALASAPTRRFHSISQFQAVLERLAGLAGDRSTPGSRRALERGAVGAALVLLLAGVSLIPRAELLPPSEQQPAAAGRPPSAMAPPAPAGSPSRADSTARRDTLQPRTSPSKTTRPPAVERSGREPPVARPETAPSVDVAPDADLREETGMVQARRPPAPRTIEDRAQIYLRIGLDGAQRQLGRPVHAIEGMSPLFHGLAMSRVPPFTDTARPVVRSVYMGPNEGLILLDQQRVRPGAAVPALSGNSWRVGDVILYLHGEARPEVLRNLSRRVR
jgi:serine/threonine protein kinase